MQYYIFETPLPIPKVHILSTSGIIDVYPQPINMDVELGNGQKSPHRFSWNRRNVHKCNKMCTLVEQVIISKV